MYQCACIARVRCLCVCTDTSYVHTQMHTDTCTDTNIETHAHIRARTHLSLFHRPLTSKPRSWAEACCVTPSPTLEGSSRPSFQGWPLFAYDFISGLRERLSGEREGAAHEAAEQKAKRCWLVSFNLIFAFWGTAVILLSSR